MNEISSWFPWSPARKQTLRWAWSHTETRKHGNRLPKAHSFSGERPKISRQQKVLEIISPRCLACWWNDVTAKQFIKGKTFFFPRVPFFACAKGRVALMGTLRWNWVVLCSNKQRKQHSQKCTAGLNAKSFPARIHSTNEKSSLSALISYVIIIIGRECKQILLFLPTRFALRARLTSKHLDN